MPVSLPPVHLLIVAAGSGARFGSDRPKQYLDLCGKPILRRTIAAFRVCPSLSSVRIVINPAHRDMYDEAVAGLSLAPPVTGGATRQDSVLAGLEALAAAGTGPQDYVLIHDAARPFIAARTIDAVIAALDRHAGAIAATPVVDTLKLASADQRIARTVPRDGLWRAETPQAFRFGIILEAHRKFAGQALTDDAAIAEAAQLDVALVPSNPENFKITHEADLARAAQIATVQGQVAHGKIHGSSAMTHEYRTGLGFDVHELEDGDAVTLCGVRIPHHRKLKGHSDADVGLHALTDALLGTIGAGDIGEHFPPSDMQWKGADSTVFLQHAAALVQKAGGRIVNVDITLLAERPRVAPYRNEMRARIASLLGLTIDRVGIKATTTEKLGFTGREEGIAAQAVASVALPIRDCAAGEPSQDAA